MLFQFRTVHPIVPKQQIHNPSRGHPDRIVVFTANVFHRFDQFALNVTRLCGFHRRINQTDTPTHCVEKEFVRGEAIHIRIVDKATGFQAVIVLAKVGERPVLETVGGTCPFNHLLTQTPHHLPDIGFTAFALGRNHIFEPARVCLENQFGGRVEDIRSFFTGQLFHQRRFRQPGLVFQLARIQIVHILLHRLVHIHHDLLDLFLYTGVHYQITESNRKPTLVHIRGHHPTNIVNEVSCGGRATVLKRDVNEAFRLCLEYTLVQDTFDESPIIDTSLAFHMHIQPFR